MDAHVSHHPALHRFQLPDEADVLDLYRAVEAAAGCFVPLAIDVEVGDRHVAHGYREENYDRVPLSILVLTPELPRDHAVEPSYRTTETWIRPRIDRAVFEEVAAHIARLPRTDPEFEPAWVRAVVAPVAARLPDAEHLEGRGVYMVEDDGCWEYVPIAWRDGQPWIVPPSAVKSPIHIELDPQVGAVEVSVRWSTWQGDKAAGRHQIAALWSRLAALGFTPAL